MKLRDFYDKLTEMIDNDTDLLDCDVIYSTDDEGNSYNPAHCTPAICYTNKVGYGMEVIYLPEVANEDKEYYNAKVICIN